MTFLESLRATGRRAKQELEIYRLVLRDPRTPVLAKILVGLAVGYLLLPFDLIPDFIPVVGHLDDLIIVPLLILLGLRLVPREVVEECRKQGPDRRGGTPHPGASRPTSPRGVAGRGESGAGTDSSREG